MQTTNPKPIAPLYRVVVWNKHSRSYDEHYRNTSLHCAESYRDHYNSTHPPSLAEAEIITDELTWTDCPTA